jgi:hypothetical protein
LKNNKLKDTFNYISIKITVEEPMYFEDNFDPREENDIQKKELNNLKSFDTGYGCVYRQKQLMNGKIVRTRIDCYTSGDVGSKIRNAETGQIYKYKVGSKDENLFFKVGLPTGELKTKNGSSLLFYDSPEQFEKHLGNEVQQPVKEKWHEKKVRKI